MDNVCLKVKHSPHVFHQEEAFFFTNFSEITPARHSRSQNQSFYHTPTRDLHCVFPKWQRGETTAMALQHPEVK